MRFLVLGAAGMLGRALARVRTGGEWVDCNRAACDILDADRVRGVVRDARPDTVILCAAYTNVDGAEAEPALALRVNGEGAGNVARACSATGAALIYPSTDYIFDGEKPAPYLENDPPAPLNAYGHSKLLGEQRVRESGCAFLIARTSWVFGPQGKHFVDAILARARSGQPLRVVTDQVGAPTYTPDLARALIELAEKNIRGVLNVTNAGRCTWHAFAKRIVERAGLTVAVAETTSAELGRPARRPRNSCLDGSKLRALGVVMPEWEDALERYLEVIGAAGGGSS